MPIFLDPAEFRVRAFRSCRGCSILTDRFSTFTATAHASTFLAGARWADIAQSRTAKSTGNAVMRGERGDG